MQSEPPSRALFRVACAWNFFWGVPLLLVPGIAMTNIGLPEPSQGVGELHARAVGLAIILFGWIYLTIGRNVVAFRSFLQIAIVAKLIFFVLVAFVCIRHRELLPMLMIALGDLLFGVLFFRAWRKSQ